MRAWVWISTNRDRTYYLTAFLATIMGIVSGFLGYLSWALGFIGIGLLGTVAFLFSKFDEDNRKKCLNPDLIILKDEIIVTVEKTQRHVNRHILFKARARVHEYRFKFFWTGSSQAFNISCGPQDGKIEIASTLSSKIFRWKMCTLHFKNFLRRQQTNLVGLHYIMPDPAHAAEAYQMLSYAHVWSCSECVIHVNFKDNLKPRAVYLIEYNAANEIIRQDPVSPQDGKREDSAIEFNVQLIHPIPDHKYSIEWDF